MHSLENTYILVGQVYAKYYQNPVCNQITILQRHNNNNKRTRITARYNLIKCNYLFFFLLSIWSVWIKLHLTVFNGAKERRRNDKKSNRFYCCCFFLFLFFSFFFFLNCSMCFLCAFRKHNNIKYYLLDPLKWV